MMADIRHSIQIAAPPEKIYPLVATGDGFTGWWAADKQESAGEVTLGFFKRTTIYRLKLEIDRPPSRVEWVCVSGQEWDTTRLIFTLEARGNTTLLRFTHAGWRAETDYFVSCTTTWGELMFRLKSAAEGKSPGPLFLADSLAY
jgi:uncharacterized protein YndB with AHSA1/START domain